MAEQIKNKAQASGRFIVVQNSMSYDTPQVTVTIDRDRAAASACRSPISARR